jgi:hypothetical protein
VRAQARHIYDDILPVVTSIPLGDQGLHLNTRSRLRFGDLVSHRPCRSILPFGGH